MIYILQTETCASFINVDDAKAYYQQLRDDEPHADINEPRRNPNDGRYVVKMYKDETVQSERL